MAHLFSPAGQDMLPLGTSNSFLESLQYRWRGKKGRGERKTYVPCAYETVPLPGLGRVVAPASASGLCDNHQPLAVAADHIGIVKPDSLDHPSVRHLANVLNGRMEVPEAGARADMWVCSASVEDCGGEPVGCIAEGEERFAKIPDVLQGQVLSPGGLPGVPQAGGMQFMREPWTNEACGTKGANAWAISVGSCSQQVLPPHPRGVSMKQCSYIIVRRKR
jgi:hypothetical protein